MKSFIATTLAILCLTIGTPCFAENPKDNSLNSTESIPEITFFESNINGKRVDFTWEAKNITTLNYFVIEKSTNGYDYEHLSTIPVSSRSLKNYQFVDSDYELTKGKSFYRIKYTDYEGKNQYSDITSIIYNGSKNNRMNPDMIQENDLIPENGKINEYVPVSYNETLVVVKSQEGTVWASKVSVESFKRNKVKAFDTNSNIPEGKYIVVGTDKDSMYGKEIIISNDSL